MPRTRKTRLPASGFASLDLPVHSISPAGTFRVHSEARPPVSFRLNPNHRFSHRDSPTRILYLAEDTETCLWECFGDEILDPGALVSGARWLHSTLSRIRFTRPLRICDLTNLDVRRRLSIDLAAINNTDLSISQEWALAIQRHPASVEGLRYPSRFTNRPCLALFERLGLESKLESRPVAPLPSLPDADAFLTRNLIHLV